MNIKQDFPILKQKIHGKELIYLDNSATTQKPKQVIQALKDYYERDNANVHRGVHELSMRASMAYENAHQVVADFINADFEEIIFTKGTTESLNTLAYSLGRTLKKDDEILLSEMEHHSNFVPWQQIAKEKGAKIKCIPLTKDFRLDMKAAEKLITKKTKIISITHCSNVLGTINPIKELAKKAHNMGALLIVDAAQSVPHMKVDIRDLDCDFLAFSGHKMFAPTGIGVLYGKKKLLETLQPFQYGGGMIQEVTLEKTTWKELPWKFEAGTPNIEGAIGLAKAIEYINTIGMKNIEKHNQELTAYAIKQLSAIKNLTIIGPKENKDRAAVISFTLEGLHPHDVGEILNQEGIAIRGGNHCAMPLMTSLKINGTNRASFHIYNNKQDIDALVKAIQKAQDIFK
ncbi:MAG: Cysteine desulfurase [archaeon GW2011_AR17]|nr:MAG: Cysteine desulfurase [archaeon GW2011_AR17]MBS3153893.1 cysteine desulfurase [Candidatus Woesearchaeota archaeon]HIH15494.1 cysteine desulfurase [Nanoarchaeota archaeon]HIH59297.1 cysteine desulfurase [Nanoarchaeota archaeon]HII13908.1 cysteine desulfurase [Nanoarchaeota archaeon]